MKLPSPLIRGRLIRRYKRFLADVLLDTGDTVTAHCANPGSMMGLIAEGSAVWLSRSTNPNRKLAYSWELLDLDDGKFRARVGINTSLPNGLAAEAITAGCITELAGYAGLRREVRYGTNSRVDLLLSDPARGDCYVEIKNAHLARQPGLAEFPDSVTARGAKHLRDLTEVAARGARAVLLFIVQRDDCQALSVADDIDPGYAAAFREAMAAGVECLVYDCRLSLTEIVINQRLPFVDRPLISARSELTHGAFA
jgi:sugar fermentation stimulation protein A